MADDLPQSLFNILRGDIAAVNARLDRLVSTDVFAAEQRRVDGVTARLGTDLNNEVAARVEAIRDLRTDLTAADAKAESAKEAQENRKISFKQALLVALISTLAAAVLGLAVLVVQNAAHLGI